MKEIKEFWTALSPLLTQVLNDSENNSLITHIDKVVKGFCDYDWEYGPSKKAKFYFCLSPAGDLKRIDEIDRIISLGPSLTGWEFFSCKPRKENVVSFLISNEKDEEITIDTHNWKCVIYKFPDQTVDLDIKIGEVNGDIDTQYYAVNIHLTNLLGERIYLKTIKGVTIVPEFSEKDSTKVIPVNNLFHVLSKHLSLET